MSNFPTGSISHGTLRPEDLIPLFAQTVIDLCKRYGEEIDGNRQGISSVERENMVRIADSVLTRCAVEGYYDSYAVADDLDGLWTILDVLAPPDHYFGTHPGDGSDYGFWPMSDEM